MAALSTQKQSAVVPTEGQEFVCELNGCGEKMTIQDDKVSGEDLVICTECPGAEQDILCEDCAVFIHRKGKKGHKFAKKLVRDMVMNKPDFSMLEMTKQKIIALVGEMEFEKIKSALAVAKRGGGEDLKYAGAVTALDCIVAVGSHSALSSVHPIAGVAVCGVQLIYYASSFFNGDICGKEFARLSVRAIGAAGATVGGMYAGAAIGGAVGSAVCPVIGTAVGIVAGVVIGAVCGWCFKKIYDHFFPSEKIKQKQEALKHALTFFGFFEKDMKDPNKFNEKELRRMYRVLALKMHPDRNGGDNSKWLILSTHYGVLMHAIQNGIKSKQGLRSFLQKEKAKQDGEKMKALTV